MHDCDDEDAGEGDVGDDDGDVDSNNDEDDGDSENDEQIDDDNNDDDDDDTAGRKRNQCENERKLFKDSWKQVEIGAKL